MNDQLQNFFEDPSADGYLLARESILAECDYRQRSFEIDKLSRLDRQKEYRLVFEEVEQMLPLWALSPRVHFLAATAAQELGDMEELETSQYLMSVCLEGLLASGEGTAENPYRITYLSDEQDILLARGLLLASQRLVGSEEGFFDVIDCQYGTQVWFAVNPLLLSQKTPATRQRLFRV